MAIKDHSHDVKSGGTVTRDGIVHRIFFCKDDDCDLIFEMPLDDK